MPARKPDMYECVEGFVTTDGIGVAVGDLVDAGHPIMKNREWAFKPFAGPRFAVALAEKKAEPKAAAKEPEAKLEAATAAPGEKRNR